MKLPTIHLNGSSGQSLLDLACEARAGAEFALARVSDIAPNARDYYVQGDTSYGDAVREWTALHAKLSVVLQELADYEQGIRTQVEERDARKRR